jgi:hypothetical protein
VYADAVIGEHAHLRGAGGHHAHLGELGSGQPDGDGTDGMHVDQTDLLPAVPDMVGDHRAVGDRIGVCHRENCRVPAQSRCCRAGFDIFGIFAAWLAQVGVQVHQSGQQHVISGINDVCGIGDRKTRADAGDLAVFDQYVDPLALAVQPDPAKQHAHAAPSFPADSVPTSTWNNTAIRT